MASALKSGGAVRVGVVGVGVMGSNHARVLTGISDVKLAGVVDPDPAQRELVTRMVGCPAVDKLDALLDLGVDAVTIAAPTHLHLQIALACIARGVHVLVEKPIASSVDEGREIIAAARRANVTLMVGHVERFNPAVQAIKEAIRGRGYPVDLDYAGRAVPATHVERRRGDRSGRARHRPDPLVHRI